MRIGLMLTACKRPYYLRQTLESWSNADGPEMLCAAAVALGQSGKEAEQIALIRDLAPGAHIWLDSPQATASRGMHRAIAEATSRAFREFNADFMICSEEDVVVSSDVITYMRWAAERFRNDPQVLTVLAHSKGGQGWDAHEPAQDADADQGTVRLLPYFNAWCWGTWPDRWDEILEPNWDFDCASGGPMDSGYDWNIATRVIPVTGKVCVVPDASRSQNIGRDEGWASTAESFAFSQAQSFREHRDLPQYHLAGEPPPLLPTDPPEIEGQLWAGLKGALAFDVGARMGENMAHFAAAGFTKVVAAEPDETCFRSLYERFNGYRPPMECITVPAAVSSYNGHVELAEVTTVNLGQVPTLVTAGTDGMEWAPADWENVPKRRVRSVTVDTLAEAHGTPDLVVVDTEGHEAKVLLGAKQVLAQGKANWLIEFHGEDLHAECSRILLEAGLRVRTIRHPHYPTGSPLYYTHGWIRGDVA